MKVFKCEKCGKMLLTMIDSGCIPYCCGEETTLLEANTTDGALEKHVPAVSIDSSKVSVQVGETAHPMMDAHYIQWIALEGESGVSVKYLKPGDAPCAEFYTGPEEKLCAVYEYCNLHGLWKKDLA